MDNHFKLLHAFTRDRDALLHAVATAPAEYPWKLELNGKAEYGPIERLDQSLRALEEIAQSYSVSRAVRTSSGSAAVFPQSIPPPLTATTPKR